MSSVRRDVRSNERIEQTRVDRALGEERVLAAAREFLAAYEAGAKPDRAALLERYADVAAELGDCLDGIELAQSLRRPSADSSADPRGSRSVMDDLSIAVHAEDIGKAKTGAGGARLGDFKILGELGRGGMGVVYEALQLSLARRVALKVLPFAAALDAKQLARFKTEAHAAAQLHHTNIVPVYAVGVDRGVHFYAMQLIEGRSLTAVIAELRTERLGDNLPASATTEVYGKRSPSGRGANSAATLRAASATLASNPAAAREHHRTVARLGSQIADALEYAHDSGVIHRDIKPGNLLLDGRGAVWITDFGLALVSTDAGLTQTGDIVGTLRYMSPEQASGRRTPVDHRSDVYSLGATLYEFVTLKPVFAGDDRQLLLQQILAEEPKSPRHFDRTIPIELETILLKSLAKNAADRYATAGDLGADLRRFLDERPILARRPTLFDKARKWMRRHPSYVGAALIVLACGFVGAGLSVVLIAHEHAQTQIAYRAEKARAQEAEARLTLARRAADEMIELAEGELSQNPFEQGLRKQLLETALTYYHEFIEQCKQQPDAQADLELTRDKVRGILADLAALQAQRRSLLLREAAVLADLRVSADQRREIDEFVGRLEQQRDALGPPEEAASRANRQTQMLATARENESVLNRVLTAGQQTRLQQIALQCLGPLAFKENEVARQLQITHDQRRRITEIGFRTMAGGPGPPPGNPPSAHQLARLEATMKNIQAVLTPEQQLVWRSLTGADYTGPKFLLNGNGPPIGHSGPGLRHEAHSEVLRGEPGQGPH